MILLLSVRLYLTLFNMLFIFTLYISVRDMFLGCNLTNNSKYRKILNVSAVLILSLVVSIINGIKNYSLYSDKYTGIFDGHFLATIVVTFVSSPTLITVILTLLYGLDKVGQQRLEKKLNNNEQDWKDIIKKICSINNFYKTYQYF